MNGYLDGNVLAGALQDVFSVEMTTALTSCQQCGHTDTLAQLRVYKPSPGLVARCSRCDTVLLRLVQRPDALWLDVSGMGPLRIALEEGP